MAEPQNNKDWFNWSAAGPIIQVVVIVAGMLIGFGNVITNQDSLAKAQNETNARVDKLYELLVYPSVANRN